MVIGSMASKLLFLSDEDDGFCKRRYGIVSMFAPF